MEPLRTAIVHYHLRIGGVTRVIQHAVTALAQENIQTVVLVGEATRQARKRLKNVRVVQGLRYGESGTLDSPENLVERLDAAANTAFGAPPDIWHFHNHCLGKNLSVPCTAYQLAEGGRRLLLQIHDFAEDGRPGNYRLLLDRVAEGNSAKLGALMYPQGAHVHYAVLNGRDLAFMASAGVRRERLHLLPNAVWMGTPQGVESAGPDAGEERLFLYPTRAIRRKNLGEFLLWSALAEGGDRFAVTLAPKNPKARPIYERWVHFAQSLGLPVEFDTAAARRESFSAMLRRAHALVTTSVAEGFGLSFLEPWLVRRPLVGRNLPEITEDFKAAGLDLSGLYGRVDVPVEWLGKETLRDKIRLALREYFQAYGRQPPPHAEERAFAASVERDRVDLGRLDESLQEQVIRTVCDSARARRELYLPSLGPFGKQGDVIERNRRLVLREFSLENYGERLARIYKRIMESDVGSCGALSSETLLEKFLAPERFSLLRAT